MDSTHDAYAVYKYRRWENITPIINYYGIPLVNQAYVCIRIDKRLPNTGRNTDTNYSYFCEHPCSPAKYSRTMHIFTDGNPRLFNIPSKNSNAWEKEYDARISMECSNKREKEDYKSTKTWYCRLYSIMILKHLDA